MKSWQSSRLFSINCLPCPDDLDHNKLCFLLIKIKIKKSHFPANCRQSAITQRVYHKVWGNYSPSHQFWCVDSWAQNTLHTWKLSPEHFLWQKLYEFRTCLQNNYRVGYSYIPNPFLTTPKRKTTKQNKTNIEPQPHNEKEGKADSRIRSQSLPMPFLGILFCVGEFWWGQLSRQIAFKTPLVSHTTWQKTSTY